MSCNVFVMCLWFAKTMIEYLIAATLTFTVAACSGAVSSVIASLIMLRHKDPSSEVLQSIIKKNLNNVVT